MVKNLPVMQETWVWSLGWEDPLEKGMGTHSSILTWRIPIDRGAWQATVHGVAKSWTWLKWLSTVQHSENLQSVLSLVLGLLNLKYSKFEKEMATHSRILAWRIQQTEEPGGLESMGWKRVGHDWATFTHSFKVRGRHNIKCLPYKRKILEHQFMFPS